MQKSAQPTYQTAVIPPKGTRRQSRRRERAKPDVGIRFSLGLSIVLARRKGMRIPTTSVRTGLGMTGQLSLPRRFRQCRGALPLLGEVPSAHTGERGRRSRIRAGGKRQHAVQTILFPIGSLSAPETPQSPSVTAPLKGAPRAKYKSAQHANPTTVIPRRAKPDVGIRFFLGLSIVLVRRMGMRIATSLVPRSRDGGSAA